jgi:two-component system cell cycle response regulator
MFLLPVNLLGMSKQQEIHDTWNELVLAWKGVWQTCHDLEAWAAFMLHCDRLHGLAHEQGLSELEASLRPLLSMLAELNEPGELQKSAVDLVLPNVFAGVREACSPASRRSAMSAQQDGDDSALPLVVVLTSDVPGMSELLLQMEHHGYAFKGFDDFQAGLQFALMQRASALLVELDQQVDLMTRALIRQASQAGLKWFAMSRFGEFELRLQAVRLEAMGFFQTPVVVGALIDALDPLAYAVREEPYRVMILDDSATVLASVQKALEPFTNLSLRAIREPERVLENLLDFSPDVLLLDFHMQGCTGLEVAKIIRQNKAFESIPLVYLTSETSEAVQLEAMRNGGDDFLTKPISQAQLVNTVISKAERYRGLRKLMVEDSLTGLFNHVKTKTLLQQALWQGERQGSEVCYAIIDIDHFKRVNDSYGHAVGDRVLRTLARYLKQRLRRADVVGRYGGEEFAIVFFDATLAQAEERLNSIREGFARIFHAYDAGIFSVTFSAGLAQYPAYAGLMELMVAADTALYAAKRAGRNQVCKA